MCFSSDLENSHENNQRGRKRVGRFIIYRWRTCTAHYFAEKQAKIRMTLGNRAYRRNIQARPEARLLWCFVCLRKARYRKGDDTSPRTSRATNAQTQTKSQPKTKTNILVHKGEKRKRSCQNIPPNCYRTEPSRTHRSGNRSQTPMGTGSQDQKEGRRRQAEGAGSSNMRTKLKTKYTCPAA